MRNVFEKAYGSDVLKKPLYVIGLIVLSMILAFLILFCQRQLVLATFWQKMVIN